MDDTISEPVEKGHISRRAVIAGGAVGAAAFWTVPFIDSVTSRAAAGSIPGVCTASPISWGYIFWLQGGLVFVTGFQKTGGGCGSNGSNPHGNFTTPVSGAGSCSSGVFSIDTFSGQPTVADFTYYGVTGATIPGTMATPAHPAAINDTTTGPGNACSFFSDNGTTITVTHTGSLAGVTLLGGIGFGAGNLFSMCQVGNCPET
jgi:hypothetical protein